jgi:DNA-binding beta-propeller fold protein YncE
MEGMDRRQFLGLGLAALPALAGVRPAARPARLALVTADTEAHVVAVALATGRIVRRIGTVEGPRSIESGPGGDVVVAHSAQGALTLLRGTSVRRVLRGLGAPRYTAMAPDGRHAFVTDGARGELLALDLRRGRIVAGVEIGAGARHVTLDPPGRTLWAALGSSAAAIAVVDVSEPPRPRLRRLVRPPFLVHDVAFSPSGRRVWVTAGRERRVAVLPVTGAGRPVLLGADDPPQHVSLGGGLAFVTSGEGGSLRAHALAGGRVRRSARIPIGAYNVQARAGVALSPSLAHGTLTITDRIGVTRELEVARAAHDACFSTDW